MADKEREAILAQAVEAALSNKNGANEPPEPYKCANGIVIGFKFVPPHLLAKVAERFPQPTPPVVEIKDKGVSEPNPNDPTYIVAKEKWSDDLQRASSDTSLVAGTFCVSVPDDKCHPEDTEWVEILTFATGGVEPTFTNQYDRYLAWLTTYAITSIRDYAEVLARASGLAGIPEELVKAAVATFPGGEMGGADSDSPLQADKHGDNDKTSRPTSRKPRRRKTNS